MSHKTFHYRNLEEVRQEIAENQSTLPLAEDVKALFKPLQIGIHELPNRICLQPMEGTDGTETGSPGPLTTRRYQRFAAGGAAAIWFEAVATDPLVRASAHQLWLREDNLDDYKRIVETIKETGLKENGYAPLVIMQATNSGRYSKPNGYPEPLVAYNCPPLEDSPLDQSRILSDDALKRYEGQFAPTAKLAQLAGFDGMDVKCCHRYLACELLSAYAREGEYGGSYENRTRFLKNAYRAAQSEVSGDFYLTSRMNVYDGFEYPWGFGVEKEGLGLDLTEPIRLIGELREEFHIPVVNVTMGNPYKNPHVNRPYDRGNYIPDEHPLVGEARMMDGIGQIQRAHADLPVIGSGFSYLRQFSPNLAAGMVETESCAMAGFGRLAFAYPSFVNDLKNKSEIDPKQTCITCGGCAQLLRAGTPAGCIIRDREEYKL